MILFVRLPLLQAQEAENRPPILSPPIFRAEGASTFGYVPSEHLPGPPAPSQTSRDSPSSLSHAEREASKLGSTYVPVDSWIYPALLRLYSLGYLDTAFLSMRPWTRQSIRNMLSRTENEVAMHGDEQAQEILEKVEEEMDREPVHGDAVSSDLKYGMESVYFGVRQVGGPVLRDSFHLGQSFVNDYGRPYSTGFNTYDGFSAIAEAKRFSLYVRGEYQHAPHYQGYSFALAQTLSTNDGIPYTGWNRPQSTIPEGPLPPQNNFRLLEANLSAHILNHEISFGKSDAWLGPGLGGGMAWSNNAENMYTFRINRVEPLRIPFVSRVLGPVRYDFFIGSLKGHTDPNDPWAHSEMFSFAPSKNFQFGFQRTIIFGGKGHAPVTLHTFLKGFFDLDDVTVAQKFSRYDPGARFTAFNFSYRLPFLRKSVTLYADSITHDDVTPLSAPRRAGIRPGIYLSHVPGIPALDLRVEASYTDFPTSRSYAGQANYDEQVQRQGYTNKGFLMGDWIGREAKGGQAWLTYHLSGNEWVSLQYLRKKNAKDFIPLGTTQNTFRVDLVKRLLPDVELRAFLQNEQWKAPVYKPGLQSDTTGAFTITWYPQLR